MTKSAVFVCRVPFGLARYRTSATRDCNAAKHNNDNKPMRCIIFLLEKLILS